MQTQAYTVNNVSIRVLKTLNFCSTYGDENAVAYYATLAAEYQYTYVWNIVFSRSYTTISPLPFDGCTLGVLSSCTNAACGQPCTNSTSTSIHHKNGYKNYYTINNCGFTGYDLFLDVTSTTMCFLSGSTHSTGLLGCANIGGNSALVALRTDNSDILKCRIIQHEFSHCFGCYDGGCPSNEYCIMKGSYDTSNPSLNVNIWCSVHSAQFNRTAH